MDFPSAKGASLKKMKRLFCAIFKKGGAQTTPPIFHPYHYSSEAEQYTFYRLPKILFTNDRYKSLSDGGKILYGLMLDRMSLSMKNGWLDKKNRVYIYFTVNDAEKYMNCKRDKAMKLLAELGSEKGVGLIERVKQGLGKPSITYAKKFIQEAGSEKPTFGHREIRS